MSVTVTVSVKRDGPAAARRALERTVRAGGVAVFPADGLYGLGCDPASPCAIERIHALKGRDEGKPSAVMFFTPLAMRELVSTLGSRTRDALGALLPGPVTLVVDNAERLYPHACGDRPEHLGVRLIEGPLAGAACAIFQTSANRSGQAPANRFEDLDPELVAGADLAIEGGELTGLASTVIDLSAIESGDAWSVLRAGALEEEEIRRRLAGAGVSADAA